MKCGFVRNSRIWNAVETLQRGDFDLWSPQLEKFFQFQTSPITVCKIFGEERSTNFIFHIHVLWLSCSGACRQSFIKALSSYYPKSKYFCHQLNLSNFVKPQGIEWGQNRLLLPKSGEKIEQCLLQQPQIEESTEKWCPRIWSQIGSKKQPTHPSAI